MNEMIQFIKDNWLLIKENPWIFLAFGGICISIGAAFVSWIDSKRIDLLKSRIDRKDDDIDRLKNDVSNLDELPQLKETVAAMRSELDAASNADFVDTYRKARDASDVPVGSVLDPVEFATNIFNAKVYKNFHEAQRQSKLLKKPLFIIVYDADHNSKSKLKYSARYFLEYKTTRDLIENEFVIALLEANEEGVPNLLPENNPLENCQWIVLGVDEQLLRNERLYANPDEGLRRTKEVIQSVHSALTSNGAHGVDS